MSFSTWHNYGYGICTDELVINSVERVEALLTFAPQFREKIHDWFEDCEISDPVVDDYMEYDQDYHLGIATILCEVILEAEGVCFLACDDYNGNAYLIYPPSYP